MTHYFSRTIIHSYCSASVPRKIFLVQLCFSVPLRSCCLGSLGVCLCIFFAQQSMSHHMLWRVKWALVVQPLENENFLA